ncbi:right-handed parallel beta-helix repeat-containing protein [Anatilimnocola floriformis]|uniref:right-handed parallel beta-helix repeat-containing protein n=1 Tax=Anatilimnocola floriformis TaxID=2948575 RepID=UPI0020C3064A|nr:right-handed parallel beta-helix repeat-containing protein [Anatilimnocola floriformis]
MSSPLSIVKRLFVTPSAKLPRRRKSYRPQVDALEERRLLAVFTVDDSFAANNPAAGQYTTIQAAVNAAAPANDFILVRAGTYNESVSVTKKLTILGPGIPAIPYVGANPNPNDLSLNPTYAAIVDPTVGGGFTVAASGVTIQGFTIANRDNGPNTQGIVLASGNSNKVISNVIVGNTIGISLTTEVGGTNTTADKATFINSNTLRNNNAPGAASGNAIYSDAGVANTYITGNRITGHLNASILLIRSNSALFNSQVTVSSNLIGSDVTNEADSAIILANLQNSSIVGNVMRNIYNNGTGIALVGGNSNVQILSNNLVNGAFTGINVIYRPDSYPVTTNNTNLLIQGNVVQNFGDGGIRLREGALNNIVRANVVQYNGFGTSNDGFGSGITLEGAINNIVESNVSYYNDADGFFADLASTGNTIRNNSALFNGEHDYHDNSVGVLNPLLTANTYTNNTGRTQNRPGLIRFFA